jgi:polysaccharide biosynthesis/export protein
MEIVNTIRNELVQGMIGALIFLLLLLTSCGGNKTRPPEIDHMDRAGQAGTGATADEISKWLSSKPPATSFSAADYLIGPEDLLEVTIFQAKELDSAVRVSASGYIRLPLIEKVHAEGMTVYELEQSLREKLKKYLSDPEVSVFVKEYRSQQIMVLGSVQKPGVFYVSGQRSVLDLLSLAGGLDDNAGDVCILQKTSFATEGEGNNIVIDLTQLLSGKVTYNLPLHSGDVILVPRSGVFFVDGAVNGPGSFSIRNKVTVSQAIAMAKGFSFDAIKSDVKIYRDSGKSEKEVIQIDYDDVLSRKTPDIELKEKDIVIVERSGFKRFAKGLAGYFNFGWFGLRSPGL